MLKISLLPALLLLATACESPLLHHETATPRALAATAGCALQFPQTGLCASLTWDRGSTEEEAGEFTLRFWNPSQGSEHGPYVDPGHQVFVKLWMPSMGHGSSPVTTSATGTGVYGARNVHFSMGGHWEIWVQLRTADRQVRDQAKVDIQIR